jgi:hypothetical protein
VVAQQFRDLPRADRLLSLQQDLFTVDEVAVGMGCVVAIPGVHPARITSASAQLLKLKRRWSVIGAPFFSAH